MNALLHIQQLFSGAATQLMNRKRFGLDGCAPVDSPKLLVLADWSAILIFAQNGASTNAFDLALITEHINTL